MKRPQRPGGGVWPLSLRRVLIGVPQGEQLHTGGQEDRADQGTYMEIDVQAGLQHCMGLIRSQEEEACEAGL